MSDAGGDTNARVQAVANVIGKLPGQRVLMKTIEDGTRILSGGVVLTRDTARLTSDVDAEPATNPACAKLEGDQGWKFVLAYTDPFGLCPWCVAAAVVLEEAARGAVIGAVVGAVEQVALNKLGGRTALEGVGHSALIGAGAGAISAGIGSAVRIGRAVGLAKRATGLTDISVASRAEAQAAGDLHVGSNRVDMVDRATGAFRGVRNPASGARFRPEPGKGHVNLQNSEGGNVHVNFSGP